MPHPLVLQLRFARREFLRGLAGVDDADAMRRLEPMNCIAWNVGHLAWHEQRAFLDLAQGRVPFPGIKAEFANGAPASTPSLAGMVDAWGQITAAADAWLDALTVTSLRGHVISRGQPIARTQGDQLQRVIYHYWYHTGENQAIRQLLGHADLPQFVGDIDAEAPYTPESQAGSEA